MDAGKKEEGCMTGGLQERRDSGLEEILEGFR